LRLSELMGKEIVNIYDGARLGTVGDSDMMIDNTTGQVNAFILPLRVGFWGAWSDRGHMIIPWEAIRKIGAEVIVVELEPPQLRGKRIGNRWAG